MKKRVRNPRTDNMEAQQMRRRLSNTLNLAFEQRPTPKQLMETNILQSTQMVLCYKIKLKYTC